MRKWMAIGGLVLVTIIWGGGFTASDMEWWHFDYGDPKAFAHLNVKPQ